MNEHTTPAPVDRIDLSIEREEAIAWIVDLGVARKLAEGTVDGLIRAALAVSPAPARDDATALRLAAQSYPFTLLGVGTTWHEAQKALIERADGIEAAR